MHLLHKLGLSPPIIAVGMDRQLFNIVPDNDGVRIITALNPVAGKALITFHGKGLVTCCRTRFGR